MSGIKAILERRWSDAKGLDEQACYPKAGYMTYEAVVFTDDQVHEWI